MNRTRFNASTFVPSSVSFPSLPAFFPSPILRLYSKELNLDENTDSQPHQPNQPSPNLVNLDSLTDDGPVGQQVVEISVDVSNLPTRRPGTCSPVP